MHRPLPPWRLRALSTLAGLGVVAGAFAAPPVPPLPLRKDGLWRGTAGASLSAASGNTRSAAMLLKFDLARLTPGDKITLGANLHYARAEIDGEESTTAARAGGVGRYDFDLGPRLFAFGKLELQRDKVLHLDLRNNIGAGLGWKVIENEANRVSLFGGIARSDDR
jgi:putative salt-induced outer membrane protein YdiY